MSRCKQDLPIKILRPDHTELVGSGFVVLTAPHSTGPPTAFNTGRIVEDAALASRAHAVIGKVNNVYSDNERLHTAHTDLRRAIDDIVGDNAIKCILDIHEGMEPGVEIGTGQGETCSDDTSNLVISYLSKRFKVTKDEQPKESGKGNALISYEKKDVKGAFMVQSVQITLGSDEREMQRDKLVDSLAELVGLINVRFGLDASLSPQSAEG